MKVWIDKPEETSLWLSSVLKQKKEVGEITYIFCDDAYLLKINKKLLKSDTLTDIISFDYTMKHH
jgi:ssRNA-specific RNase YbeY (16S rRNA maturation enzyme)